MAWKQKLYYTLCQDEKFSPFVAEGATWLKFTKTAPNRGLQQVGSRSVADLLASLTSMLELIASYCPIVSRNSIVRNSTSLTSIWEMIREHFGFQSTGAHFLDLASIKLEVGERHEDLYQKLLCFFDDNLLTADCGLTHCGDKITADEELSPSLHNTIIVLWLQLIHPGLPALVKQRYGPELRNKTVASIKSEISQCIPSLLDELRDDDSKIQRNYTRSQPVPFPRAKTSKQHCTLCAAAKRPGFDTHFLSRCKFLPDADRRALSTSRSRAVDVDNYNDAESSDEDDVPHDDSSGMTRRVTKLPLSQARRVATEDSPVLICMFDKTPVEVVLDCGATSNIISYDIVQKLNIPMSKPSQLASTTDKHRLNIVGEVFIKLSYGGLGLSLDALVAKNISDEILGGMPFMKINDIGVRPKFDEITIQGTSVSVSPAGSDCKSQAKSESSVRRTQATVLRVPVSTTILPGDSLEIPLPDPSSTQSLGSFALEPRYDCKLNSKSSTLWPEFSEVSPNNNMISLTNDTSEPIHVVKDDHICQIRQIIETDSVSVTPDVPLSVPKSTPPTSERYSAAIKIDPDNILPPDIKLEFEAIHKEFNDVFNPAISRYNGHSGPIQAVVNVGPTLPPQQKGRLPLYNRSQMIEYQQACDLLESSGVLAKPEDVGVNVEYLNLSFLANQPGKTNKRFVTSFGQVAQFCKPSPSLMPSVESVLIDMARWKYLIITDLKKAYFQIPLSKASMKYCGIATPFKGVRVYTRAAMGMPGSETCLEELLSRILGQYIQEGWVARIADDLYVGADSLLDLLAHWRLTLKSLQLNNLRLNAPKTLVCPKSAMTLGWIWSSGTLSASPHKISALQNTPPPVTVQGMRSFVGAYKILCRVLYGYAELLNPLDRVTAGRQSQEKIAWDESLSNAFAAAKAALSDSKSITVPRPSDEIWIVTDASVKSRGLAATMYVRRDDAVLLSGFYNVKLRGSERHWMPCELEALCIAAAVKHFSPYLVQSHHRPQVLTDSRPCVQAYEKLLRGEFSASARVSTFLSTITRYKAAVSHIAGVANAPSDYASRNPVDCSDQSCQVCKFVQELEESTVRVLSVADVINGSARMPYMNRSAWLATQHECEDLRRTHSYLVNGTRPQRRAGNLKDVKRYLQSASVSPDGLLVVKDSRPFQPSRDLIIVPRAVISGLLTTLHLRFNHPSAHQLKASTSRYFFALDMDKAIHDVTSSCHQCTALRSIPVSLHTQSSEPPPSHIGLNYSADVMKRYGQLVLILRETVSSFTCTHLISNETRSVLQEGLIQLCSQVRPHSDRDIFIRTDPAPGFKALVGDAFLKSLRIFVVLGNAKNKNKNPVSERAVEELGLEILHAFPDGGPISPSGLAVVTNTMNSRIRYHGLSSYEIFTQRDQLTSEPLPLNDKQLIQTQFLHRSLNHGPSALSKSHGKGVSLSHNISVGDLVYVKSEKDKTKSRDKYLVISVSNNRCSLRKFTTNQLRAQSYDLPIADVYPIQSSVLLHSSPQHVRGLDDDAASLAGDDLVPPSASSPPAVTLPDDDTPPAYLPAAMPPIPAVATPEPAVMPPTVLTDPPCQVVAGDDSASSDDEHSQPRTSTRQRTRPSWQLSGDWDLT